MNEQTGYLLLGALLAITVVLLISGVIVLILGVKVADYIGRFKGLKLSRNGQGDMTFGGVIDERRPEPALRSAPPVDMPAEALEDPQSLQ